MARQIEITGVPGETSCTLSLFPPGSATATEAAISATETAKSGAYLGTVTAAAGDYDCRLLASDGVLLANGTVRVSAVDSTVFVVDAAAENRDLSGLVLALLSGTINTADSALEVFTLTLDGAKTYTASIAVDSSGNRSSQTLAIS